MRRSLGGESAKANIAGPSMGAGAVRMESLEMVRHREVCSVLCIPAQPLNGRRRICGATEAGSPLQVSYDPWLPSQALMAAWLRSPRSLPLAESPLTLTRTPLSW